MGNVGNLHGRSVLFLIGQIEEYLNPRRLRGVQVVFPRGKGSEEWRFGGGDQVSPFVFSLARRGLAGFVTGNFTPDRFQEMFLQLLSWPLSLNGVPCGRVYLKQGWYLLDMGF